MNICHTSTQGKEEHHCLCEGSHRGTGLGACYNFRCCNEKQENTHVFFFKGTHFFNILLKTKYRKQFHCEMCNEIHNLNETYTHLG